jgi:hypothetical protein
MGAAKKKLYSEKNAHERIYHFYLSELCVFSAFSAVKIIKIINRLFSFITFAKQKPADKYQSSL